MTTLNQLQKKQILKKKKHKTSPALRNRPQVKGVVMRARILTPRKPNSAKRPIAKIILSSRNRLTAHIPGIGHNLRRHSATLVRGGGARDLPGVYYTCIRGVYDFASPKKRKRRRSIYGLKIPTDVVRKKRKKFRNL